MENPSTFLLGVAYGAGMIKRGKNKTIYEIIDQVSKYKNLNAEELYKKFCNVCASGGEET